MLPTLRVIILETPHSLGVTLHQNNYTHQWLETQLVKNPAQGFSFQFCKLGGPTMIPNKRTFWQIIKYKL